MFDFACFTTHLQTLALLLFLQTHATNNNNYKHVARRHLIRKKKFFLLQF